MAHRERRVVGDLCSGGRFGAQLIAYIWIPHWQQGLNAVTTLMLLTSPVIGVLVALIEYGREKQLRR